ncbi:MAG: chemotaxis protein CheD [Gemmatimonas sp.]|uniref:chemotaxis protein CheD n=1 Tax=Gemmatimonas sp. UBA7669 TaxID=1946568 RepID=UPI0025C0E008|nr:chemotaxis protein CheD [Gemmatimonas sp. UBA7669]MBA3917189.1 chemotaxis protein CheD [Gemmatimonas sp.]MBL0890785.1 chemotaxis protein CheD [Gemmatimonadaceae bacterium]
MGTAAPVRPTEKVVGVADLKVSNVPGERLITYALGSCLGIVVHDPVAGVAGMLHVMLPTGTIDPAKMADKPAMFVDSGVPLLFKECYKLGARKERMQVKVAGGAHAGAREEDDRFQIGKRNMIALRKLLWKNGVMIHANDTGGVQTSRTMWVDVTTGEVTLKINGTESTL